MHSRLARLTGSLGLGALVLLACEDTNLINNPSFDLWCGGSLCGWQLDAGQIARVATWHEKDYGLSFEQTPTQISQLSLADPVRCLRFELIADVEPEAQLALLLDFNDDGVIDSEQRVPAV